MHVGGEKKTLDWRIIENSNYRTALSQAIWTTRSGSKISDMPMLIDAMRMDPKLMVVARDGWVDTFTSEFYGYRMREPFYEVLHSCGPFTTIEGFDKYNQNGLMKHSVRNIPSEEWQRILAPHGLDLVHVSELKRGNAPKPGTQYKVFALPRKDFVSQKDRQFLNYDAFMKDERTLMLAGSMDNVDFLAKLLFLNEDWRTVQDNRAVVDALKPSHLPIGHAVALLPGDLGMCGNHHPNYFGRFLTVKYD